MPAATLTYPHYPLVSTDADFNAKLQADLDAIRAFVNNAQMNTSNLSATAGIVGTQIANAAITGAKVATGVNGLAGINIQDGVLTANHMQLNTLGENEVDWTTANGLKSRRTGVVGRVCIGGRKAFTVPSGSTFHTITITPAADCDYTPPVFPSTNLRGWGVILSATDPGTSYHVWPTLLTSTSYQFQVLFGSALAAAWPTSGTIDLDWEVEGL